MWRHNYEPVAGSLGASAVAAAIPIVVLFVMLGVLRKPAWMSALSALAAALVVALGVYGMPVQLALISTIYGAAYGLFPIAWIVFSSIMLYRLAVDTGKFEIIKDSVGTLTDDRRLQALFIAFSFGAFIEGAAGFGAPVAVSGAMLAGLGFDPFFAAGMCLLANTAPVAFGSIGIPVITLANVTGLPVMALSAMIGRLCAMMSVVIPGYLIVVMAGPARALEVLPAIIACGVSFAGMQFLVSNFIGPDLTDIMSSLTCIVVMVAVLKLWRPARIMRLEGESAVVVDYKTNSLAEGTPEEIVENDYHLQRLVYALACFRAGAQQVEVVYHFLERPDAVVSTVFRAEQIAELEAELSEAIARINAGEFRPTPSEFACADCPALDLVCAGPRLRGRG